MSDTSAESVVYYWTPIWLSLPIPHTAKAVKTRRVFSDVLEMPKEHLAELKRRGLEYTGQSLLMF